MSEESNQRLKTQPDDDDLSSAGLIQQALTDYKESSKKASTILPPTQEISFFPSSTPPADKYRRWSTTQSSTTVTPGPVLSSSSSSSTIRNTTSTTVGNSSRFCTHNTKVRIKNEVYRHTATYPSTTHKQHFNNDDDDDDEVQLMKVERKRATPSDQSITSTQKKRNKMNGTQHSIAGLGFVEPSPPLSSQPLCTGCGNKGYMCHHYQFSGYCTKACMSYLQMNREGWETGFNVETMERVFYNAYNEARRVTFEERFGYYSPAWVEVPDCMTKKALHIAVDLGFNVKLCNELKEHNENGKKKYEDAQNNHRA